MNRWDLGGRGVDGLDECVGPLATMTFGAIVRPASHTPRDGFHLFSQRARIIVHINVGLIGEAWFVSDNDLRDFRVGATMPSMREDTGKLLAIKANEEAKGRVSW